MSNTYTDIVSDGGMDPRWLYEQQRRNETGSRRLANDISNWILEYAESHAITTLVVGVSGGIDSAVVSTLCALTGKQVLALTMPIRQSQHTHAASMAHAAWLKERYPNVRHQNVDLGTVFGELEQVAKAHHLDSDLALANSRSRLRMTMLYQAAQSTNGIVVGTGNRVEDFGVGFFTKYGDGGVDISPIGDLMKTQVWQLGRELGILDAIISAQPTDGLWDDGRTDQDQLGMTYAELELAMQQDQHNVWPMDAHQQLCLQAYRKIRARNLHKMTAIPVYPHEQ